VKADNAAARGAKVAYPIGLPATTDQIAHAVDLEGTSERYGSLYARVSPRHDQD
jgi:hypothetical protein